MPVTNSVWEVFLRTGRAPRRQSVGSLKGCLQLRWRSDGFAHRAFPQRHILLCFTANESVVKPACAYSLASLFSSLFSPAQEGIQVWLSSF